MRALADPGAPWYLVSRGTGVCGLEVLVSSLVVSSMLLCGLVGTGVRFRGLVGTLVWSRGHWCVIS